MLNYLFDLAPVLIICMMLWRSMRLLSSLTEGDREADKKTDWMKTWDSLS